MAIIKEKLIVTQRIHGDCPTHSRTELSTRDVRTVVDEPEGARRNKYRADSDRKLVAALIACTNVHGHKCARKHSVNFSAMSIDAEASSTGAERSCWRRLKSRFQKSGSSSTS